MTQLVIFYIDKNEAIAKKSIDHTNWTVEAPHNILKVWIKESRTAWMELRGWGAYYFKDVNGKPVWGGTNAINQIENFTLKKPMAIEDIFPKEIAPAFLKYGIKVSEEVWKDVDSRRPE